MHDMPRPRGGRYRLHASVDEVTRRRVGNANPRGRLERANGPFLLREELDEPGSLPFGEAFDLVAADWERQRANATIGEVSLRYVTELRGLQGTLARLGQGLVRDITPNTVLMWMKMPGVNGRPIERGHMSVRRSAVRAFFQTAFCLGLTDANPAKVVELPGATGRYVQPFTDTDIAQLQRVARTQLNDTRTPAALALVMSGAGTGEIPFVTLADVDLPNRRVWVHDGGYRLRERWILMEDDWCVDALKRRVEAVKAEPTNEKNPDPWLIYKPHPTKPSLTRQRDSGGPFITALLKGAGIYQPGVVRAESLREWLAVRVYAQTGHLEAVAVRLGMSSLDAAAHIVGLHWDEDLSLGDAPAHRRSKDADQ